MDEPQATPEQAPPPSRLRYSRRRFLKMAGALAAGAAAVVSFGYWAQGKGAPRRTVASGGTTDLDTFLADFPVNAVETIPRTPPQQWQFTIDGMVDSPVTVDWAAWQKLKRADETVDFNCVEGWTVDNVAWGGVRLATVLDLVRPLPQASVVRFYAQGGTYDDDLTLEQSRDPAVMLADTIEGSPLPPAHGGPLRLVVPAQLGYKSVKWVVRIELDDQRRKGYWERYGYPVEAPVPAGH
jgi:DMSO/TMAO reductase YedYZ molybdopterin-dependent catalytic subunit